MFCNSDARNLPDRLVNLVTTHPEFTVEFVLVDYDFDVDFETLAREMIREELSAEFVEAIRTGWWTCCLIPCPSRSVHKPLRTASQKGAADGTSRNQDPRQ